MAALNLRVRQNDVQMAHAHAQAGSLEARNWWKYVWLPAAPLLFALIGKYVTNLLEESSKGVQGLQSQMYSFKKV